MRYPETERAYVIAQAAQDEFIARNRVADQDIVNLFQLAIELDPSQVTQHLARSESLHLNRRIMHRRLNSGLRC